jgi:hypothetical protein
MATQRPRVRGHPVAREVNQTPLRHHAIQTEAGEAEGLDLRDPRDRPLQTAARWLRRPPAPALKIREPPTVRNSEQTLELPALPGREQPGKRVPQALGRVVTHTSDQPRERRDARQQRAAFNQPADRIVEDRLRAVTRRPRPRVNPLLKLQALERVSANLGSVVVEPLDHGLGLQEGIAEGPRARRSDEAACLSAAGSTRPRTRRRGRPEGTP